VGARRWQSACKRLCDFLVALGLLLLLSPLLAATALAIKLGSSGPVLFRQEREGWHGRRFFILKFRTMHATGQSPDGQGRGMRADGTLLKMPHDPRVTAIGRWLRKTSVDELPQLWNVLRGEMSLVGPRPLIPFMLEGDQEFRQVRALVRPGLTGLWQLRDRANNTSAAAMRPHDLEYIERFSLGLDFLILLRTIPAVLAGKGAF
jgi:lipopolysaccharide/colanic/teichoic acid biosynthesis glycosyltransferase